MPNPMLKVIGYILAGLVVAPFAPVLMVGVPILLLVLFVISTLEWLCHGGARKDSYSPTEGWTYKRCSWWEYIRKAL